MSHGGHDPNESKIQLDDTTFAYITPDGCINLHNFSPENDEDDCVHICGQNWDEFIARINAARG